MSEDTTKDMPDRRTFEERVLASLESLHARLDVLEEKVEKRMYDTRPIWERTLVEMIEANKRLASLERKMEVLGKDVLNLRSDLVGVDERMRKIEDSDVTLIG